MYALSLKVCLVSLMIISIDGAPADATTAESEYGTDQGEPTTMMPEPFNPEQYKQYLLELQCQDIFIEHGGTKTPEEQSSSIYKPTTTTERIADDEEEEEDSDDEEEETSFIKAKRSTGTEGPASANITSEVNTTEVCTVPLISNWGAYNWYQILVNNGGAPGKLNDVSAPKPNLTKAEDPCARPLRFSSPLHDEVWYITKTLEPEKRVYREERVSLRFPDTPHEFVDVKGLLVWSPPGEKHRSYHISYRKDDTGLYVLLDRQNRCRFTDPLNTSGVNCEEFSPFQCFCEDDGSEKCIDLPQITPVSGSISPGLQAALIGGK